MSSTNMGNKEKMSIEENFLEMRKEREDKQKEQQKSESSILQNTFLRHLR